MGPYSNANMSTSPGYSATPTEDFSVIEIPERRATDPAYYWKVSTAFLGVVAVAFIVATIAVSGQSTETVDATPAGNTDLMWGNSHTPQSPEMCGRSISVNIHKTDSDLGFRPWETGKYEKSGEIYIGGIYDTFGHDADSVAYNNKHWPKRFKNFPDAHIQTWRDASWDCKGNDRGGCNGDRDQWITLGCEFCDAEEAKAAAGKWAIWHTVGHSNAKCGKEMEDQIWVKGGCDNPEGACHDSKYIDGPMIEGCDQDTIPRHGMVKLIATYDDRHIWSPKIWTDYNHPSITVKATQICCHPVCATDPGCGDESAGFFGCFGKLGGCCEPNGLLSCGYAGPKDECEK